MRSIFKPDEMSALFKLKFGTSSLTSSDKNDIPEYDDNLKYCFHTLDQVSRSFSSVIRQLPNELSTNVCLFYLILRALDSIEDDMDLPVDMKIKLLRNFYTKNYEKGWSISGVGDKEEYRELLANYDKVILAFLSIDFKYQEIITDICQKMGAGMADFVEKKVSSLKDYNLYCHYVAGLVGIGLSQIFSASGMEDDELQSQEDLANSMGLFLQKTNIVRDYREDLEENRIFWPKDIWGLYTSKLENFALNPQSKESMSCLNHLVNDALSHATDCLEYLKMLRNNNIFRFCAIPQVMAMATLCEVYNNHRIFTKNVKIRKGFAAKLIVNTNSIEDVVKVYEDMAITIEDNIPLHDTPNSKETLRLIKKIKAYCRVESVLKIEKPTTIEEEVA